MSPAAPHHGLPGQARQRRVERSAHHGMLSGADDLGFVSPKRLCSFLGFVPPKYSAPFRSSAVTTPNSIVPGERAPGRLGGFAPIRGRRSADRRWCGSPHPVARLAAKPVPSAEGNGRPITRAGAPLGAPPRRFSFVLETAFWERTGAPIRNALDSAEFFALRSSAPTSPLPDGPT